MKKNCCPHEHELIAYRLNMLSPAERKLIEEHIAVCPRCRQAMQIELEIDEYLSTPMDPGTIENYVLQRVRAYQKTNAAASWWQYPLGIVLNLLAGIALGLGIWTIFTTRFNTVAWMNEFLKSLNKSLNTDVEFYIMNGIGFLFLLTSFLFAFRKRIFKDLI